MQESLQKEGLSGRVRPGWFDDEKFGIFIHWGPYSVPAYAPVDLTSGQRVVYEQTSAGVRFSGLHQHTAGTCTLVIPGGA